MVNLITHKRNAEIAGAVMNGGRVDIKFGAVYEYTGSKKALIEGCEFNNNTTTIIGALDCESYSNITGCRFTGNSATNYGALKMNYGNLIDSEFNNNSAINSVGAFGSTILDNIVNCIFINNNAKDGGAIMVRHFNNIKGCKMENNTASKLGGAIYIMPGFLDYEYQLSNNEFKNNNAEEGSSLYCGRDVVFLNNKFEDDLLNSTQIKLYNGAKITYL